METVKGYRTTIDEEDYGEVDLIQLDNKDELIKLSELLFKEENFVLQFNDSDHNTISELIIANNIASKVKNGEIILRSIQEYSEE